MLTKDELTEELELFKQDALEPLWETTRFLKWVIVAIWGFAVATVFILYLILQATH